MDLGELKVSLVYIVSSRKPDTDKILNLKTLIDIIDGSGLILIMSPLHSE